MEYIRYLGWLEKFRPRISQEYLAADPAEKNSFWVGRNPLILGYNFGNSALDLFVSYNLV